MGCREIPRKNRCQEASQLLLSVPRACPARQSQPAQPPVVPARGCRLASPGITCLSWLGSARCCSHRRAMPARDAAMQGLGHRRVLRFCSWTCPSPCLQALGEQ